MSGHGVGNEETDATLQECLANVQADDPESHLAMAKIRHEAATDGLHKQGFGLESRERTSVCATTHKPYQAHYKEFQHDVECQTSTDNSAIACQRSSIVSTLPQDIASTLRERCDVERPQGDTTLSSLITRKRANVEMTWTNN